MSQWLPPLASMILTASPEPHNGDARCQSPRPRAPPHPGRGRKAFQNALPPGTHPLPSPAAALQPPRGHSTRRHSHLLSRSQIRSSAEGLRLLLSPQTIKHARLDPRTRAGQTRSERVSESVCPRPVPPSSHNPPEQETDSPPPVHSPCSWEAPSLHSASVMEGIASSSYRRNCHWSFQRKLLVWKLQAIWKFRNPKTIIR